MKTIIRKIFNHPTQVTVLDQNQEDFMNYAGIIEDIMDDEDYTPTIVDGMQMFETYYEEIQLDGTCVCVTEQSWIPVSA